MKKIALLFLLLIALDPVMADISEGDFGDLKGFSVLGTWAVTGWHDDKGGKKGDSFEGCEMDRVILLDDNLQITCAEYHYSYSYRPKAVILGDGGSLRMLLGGHIYRMRR